MGETRKTLDNFVLSQRADPADLGNVDVPAMDAFAIRRGHAPPNSHHPQGSTIFTHLYFLVRLVRI